MKKLVLSATLLLSVATFAQKDELKTLKKIYAKETISEKDLEAVLWAKIKDINKTLPMYKYIKHMTFTSEPLIKTTTNKIKRNEELKQILTKEENNE